MQQYRQFPRYRQRLASSGSSRIKRFAHRGGESFLLRELGLEHFGSA